MSRNLYEYIKNDTECRNILLFSEGGAGKSTQLIYTYNKVIEDVKKGEKTIPVYVDVKSLQHSEKKPVFKYLYSVYFGRQKYSEDIDKRIIESLFDSEKACASARMYKYLFLIDGMNETANKTNIINDIKKLMQYEQCRFVVASRVIEEDYIFDDFVQVKLCKIKEKQIIKIIEKKLGDGKKLNISRINTSLLEILKNPLFMKTFCNAYGKAEIEERLYEKKDTRQADILSAYIVKILEDIKDRAEVDENNIMEFTVKFLIPKLAFYLENKNAFVISDKDFLHMISENDEGGFGVDYFRSLLNGRERGRFIGEFQRNIDKIQEYCRNSSLLEYSEFNDSYKFSHHVWRDYFAALHEINLMKAEKYDELEYLQGEDVRHFVGEMIKHNGKCECDYISKKDCLSEKSPIERYLQEHYLELNSRSVVIKNLVEVMKSARNNSITACYDNLNLEKVKFIGCDFPRSSFKNSVVYEKNFSENGHSGYVYDAVITPDNSKIVSCGKDNTIRIWDIEKHEQVGKSIVGHKNYIVSLKLADNGKVIASGSYDKTIRLWNAETKEQIGETFTGHCDEVNMIDISPDEKLLVSCSNDATVRVWSMDTHKEITDALHGHDGKVNCVHITFSGRFVLSGGNDGSIRVWDIKTGKQLGKELLGHNCYVKFVCSTPDERHIVSGGSDGKIIIWDMETHERLCEPLEGHEGSVEAIIVTNDSKRALTAGYDGYIRVWDIKRRCFLNRSKREHNDWVNSVNISKDGKSFVSAGGDQKIFLWNLESLCVEGEAFVGSAAWVNSIKADGNNRFVSGGDDALVRVWDIEKGRIVNEPMRGHSARINAVDIIPGENRIITGSDDSTVCVWDMNSNSLIGKPLKAHSDWVRALAVSEDGKCFISGGWDKKAYVWDAEKLTVKQELVGHGASVEALAVMAGGKLVSGSDDTTIRVWDMSEGVQVGKTIAAHDDWIRTLAVMYDNRRIVTGSWDNTVKIWDLASGMCMCDSLEGHTNRVDSVDVTKDGKCIVSGSDDNSVRVWRDEQGGITGSVLAMHSNAVSCVELTDDDRYVISGDGDGRIKVTQIDNVGNSKELVQLSFNGYGADLSEISPLSELSEEFLKILYQNGCIV